MLFADIFPDCSTLAIVAIVMWLVVAYQIRAMARKTANAARQVGYYAASHPHQTSVVYHVLRSFFGR